MLIRKVKIGIVLILCLVAAIVPCGITVCASVIAPVTKSAVNVALYKPVTASSWYDINNYPKTNINDDDATNIWAAAGSTTSLTDNSSGTFAWGNDKQWIQIDLLRRYKVEKIEIHDRQYGTSADNRSNFQILCSNNPAFTDPSTYTVLGGIDALNDNLFKQNGVYTIDLSAVKAPCRYIRYTKTNVYNAPALAEIKVFASLTATEVSRNATTVASSAYDTSLYSASKANDGKNQYSTDAWVPASLAPAASPNPYIYHYWYCDLGKAYNIGLIDMEGRLLQSDDVTTRNNFAIYGSNLCADDAMIKATSALETIQAASPATGYIYTQLSKLKLNNTNEINGYYPFPAISSGKPRPYYETSVNDNYSYRYLTYRKIATQSAATIGEFRAYIINPEVYSLSIDAQKVTIGFSDEMDKTTLNSGNIKLIKADNTELPYSVQPGDDDYTYTMVFNQPLYNVNLKLSVSGNVLNKKSVPVVNSVQNISTPKELDISRFDIVDSKDGNGNVITALPGITSAGSHLIIKNNSVLGSKNIMVIIALYNENNTLVSADEKDVCLSQGDQQDLKLGLDMPDGKDLSYYTLRVYVWDDYDSMMPWTDCKSIIPIP